MAEPEDADWEYNSAFEAQPLVKANWRLWDDTGHRWFPDDRWKVKVLTAKPFAFAVSFTFSIGAAQITFEPAGDEHG